jgi:hypothetical protein
MARLFQDGAEFNNTLQYTTAGAPTVSTTHVRSGTYAYRINTTANTASIRRDLFASNQAILGYFRTYLYIASLPSADNAVFDVLTVSNTRSCGLRLLTTGALALIKADGTQLGSNSPVLSVGQWYCLELKSDATGVGAIDARIDGVSFASGANSSQGSWGRLRLGTVSNSNTDLYYDDIAANDASGSYQNTWCGEGKIIHLRPNAAGDANQWLDTSGGAGTTNNYTLVDEASTTGVDWVARSGLNNVDMYNVDDSGLSATDTINTVVIVPYYANVTTVDAVTAVKFRVEKTSGGTIEESAAYVPNSLTQAYIQALVTYLDPDGAAWTSTTLDSMQIGQRISTGGTFQIKVNTICASVDYTPISSYSGADTGTGTEAGAVAAALLGSDIGAFDDLGYLGAAVTHSDSYSGVDSAGSVVATLPGTDLASVADVGMLTDLTAPYDPSLLTVEKLTGAAMLGWFVLGESRLGESSDTHTLVDTVSVSIADGYTIGEGGELSLDPATATITVNEHSDDESAFDLSSLILPAGSRARIAYGDVTLFSGTVTGVSVGIEPTGYGDADRRIVYTLASKEVMLFGQTVAWTSLPAETAYERLSRWFDIDTLGIAPTHAYRMDVELPEETEGSATLLDLARAFSAATGLPLRFASPDNFAEWNQLTVFDTAADWPDQPLAVPGVYGVSAAWTTAVSYATVAGQMVPEAVEVKHDDMRFAIGQSPVLYGGVGLGTLRLGTDRLGSAGSISSGFASGNVVDVFGTPAVVARVTQAFGTKHYSADLELAAPLHFNGDSPTTPLTPLGAGTPAETVNVVHYGAVGNGIVDDGPAIRAAVANGGEIFIPPGTYYFKATSGSMNIPAGTRIRGVRGRTIINLDTDTPGAYREFARNNGDDITVEDLTINRVSDFLAVIFPVKSFAGFTMRGLTLNGNRDIYTANSCHGIQLGISTGVTSRVKLLESNIINCKFGLFQANASTSVIEDVQVRECSFAGNYADDLCFNSPNGTTTGIRVERCTFADNQSIVGTAGFAVDVAHGFDVVISGNTITNYNNEGIHIEDYSQDVVIDSNVLTDCGLLQGSYVQIITRCTRVRISNNTFLVVNNSNTINVVNVLAGAVGTTPGGRTANPPTNVIVTGNHFFCTGTVNGIYIETVLRATVTNNQMIGPGVVTAGVYAGAYSIAIDIYTGLHSIVSGNIVRGFANGTHLRTDSIHAFGDGAVISSNVFADCLLGIGATDTAAAVYTGNMFYDCQYPMIMSTGPAGNVDSVIIGNNAVGCANPLGIYGSVKVTTTGTATIGSSRTVAVAALPASIPAGTVITFSGGGVLTTTVAATWLATSIVGNLATANIASGETATAFVPFTAGQNRLIANNGDSFYGAAGYGEKTVTTAVSYALAGFEKIVIATAGSITITLPPAANYAGFSYGVKNTAGSSLTVAAVAGNIDGSATVALAAGAGSRYTSDGTNWWAI